MKTDSFVAYTRATVPTRAELAGVAIVAAGSFNPSIYQPSWLVANGLLEQMDADASKEQLLITAQVTSFTAGWLTVQVTEQQALFAVIEEARETDLRDFAAGIFELLPHAPIDAVGVNADTHFRTDSEEHWHRIGDRFLPKEQWDPLFPGDDWRIREKGHRTGLRSMIVESYRPNGRDYVRVEVAPSVRVIPLGVYIGINSHFQIRDGEKRGNARDCLEIIKTRWESTRDLERDIQEKALKWTE